MGVVAVRRRSPRSRARRTARALPPRSREDATGGTDANPSPPSFSALGARTPPLIPRPGTGKQNSPPFRTCFPRCLPSGLTRRPPLSFLRRSSA